VAFTLDPDHSFVHFEVQHFGTSTTRGRFGPVRGVVLLDRAAGRGELSLRIPTASVDTGIAVFNARLRQADLLASNEITPKPSSWPHAFASKASTWPRCAASSRCAASASPCPCMPRTLPAGRGHGEVCGGDFEGELLRSDFGASFGLPLVGDRVRLKVQVEAGN
jgi:polyisoprenoid-binding protein YceI